MKSKGKIDFTEVRKLGGALQECMRALIFDEIRRLCPFEIEHTDRVIQDEIYNIMSEINSGEGFGDYEEWYIIQECKRVADTLLEEKQLEVWYPCCGGSGCVRCLL